MKIFLIIILIIFSSDTLPNHINLLVNDEDGGFGFQFLACYCLLFGGTIVSPIYL